MSGTSARREHIQPNGRSLGRDGARRFLGHVESKVLAENYASSLAVFNGALNLVPYVQLLAIQCPRTHWPSVRLLPTTMAKTALITGATGLLGRQILKAFRRAGWDVVGTGFTRAQPPSILKVNLESEEEIATILDEVK